MKIRAKSCETALSATGNLDFPNGDMTTSRDLAHLREHAIRFDRREVPNSLDNAAPWDAGRANQKT
jgi:hypothetical protein